MEVVFPLIHGCLVPALAQKSVSAISLTERCLLLKADGFFILLLLYKLFVYVRLAVSFLKHSFTG